jgi:hypothetical protein
VPVLNPHSRSRFLLETLRLPTASARRQQWRSQRYLRVLLLRPLKVLEAKPQGVVVEEVRSIARQ